MPLISLINMSSSLLFLLLSLIIQACGGARHLGVVVKDSSKDAARIEPDIGSNPLKESRDGGADGSLAGASVEKLLQEDLESLPRKMKEEYQKASISSGGNDEDVVSSSHVGLQETTKLEELKRRALSKSGPHVGSIAVATEESKESKEGHVVADVLTMDYEQPHRKPPIHN